MMRISLVFGKHIWAVGFLPIMFLSIMFLLIIIMISGVGARVEGYPWGLYEPRDGISAGDHLHRRTEAPSYQIILCRQEGPG